LVARGVIITEMSGVQSDSLAVMRRSLVPADTVRVTERRIDGAPVYEFVRHPEAPPVSVMRFSAAELPAAAAADHVHAHDFLAVAYFERGGGPIRLDNEEWPVAAGDAFVIAPGVVVGFGGHDRDRVAPTRISAAPSAARATAMAPPPST
jgi:quercetin dioxygenase-like cupin family protein